jgi:hypothetical protein
VNQEMHRTVVVWGDCIKEVITAPKIAQAAYVRSNVVGDSIPTSNIQVRDRNGRAYKTHSASTIGNGKATPI